MNIKNIDEKKVLSLYKEDKTLMDIASELGCKSYGPIKRILLNNGIILRRKGELRPQGKLSIDVDYFKIIDSNEKAYWLGYLTADGCIHEGNYKTTLTSKDREIIEKFKFAIKSEHSIGDSEYFDIRTKKTYVRHTIQITSKHFTRNLIRLGLSNRKSFSNVIPNVPSKYFSHYVRGLFDGDGCICFLKRDNKRKINIIATENIISNLQNYLVNTLNFSKTKMSLIAEKDGMKICKLHINRFDNQDEFIKFIYKNSTSETRLSRKYNMSNL